MAENYDGLASAILHDPRVDRIERDFWFGYSNAKYALDKVEYFINKPKRNRPLNLAIIAPTNNGKSMILDRVERLHPAVNEPENWKIERPVVSIQQVNTPDETRFYNAILSALGLPVRPNEKPENKLETIVTVLTKLNTKLLIVDEFHKMLTGSQLKQRTLINGMRTLSSRLKIPFLIAGTNEVKAALGADPEMRNRFEFITLPPWKDGEELDRLLNSFKKVAALSNEYDLTTDKVVRKILAMTDGMIGEIVNLLRAVAVNAIVTGQEEITLDSFGKVKWEIPSARGRK